VAKHTELGLKLQEIRVEKGLSLREAAKLTGVDRETIGGIERGTRKAYPVTLGKIAKGLGVPPRELLTLEGATKEEPVGAGEAAAPRRSRTWQQSHQMEEAAGSVLLREPAFGKLLWIIHGVDWGDIPTEEAEVLVAELFVSREEAMRWVEERILSGALSVEAVQKDGRRYPFALEDVEKLGNKLETDLVSHLYGALRPIGDSWRGGEALVITLKTGDQA
jgi:transcriptional regulator with XRE-family HTH domain